MSGELGFGFLLGLASRPVAFLALLSFYSCTNVVYARRIYRVLRHSVFDIHPSTLSSPGGLSDVL